MEKVRAKIAKWEAELESLTCSWRWGETRRFQSNHRVIERANWLIDRISTAKSKLTSAAPVSA